MLDRNDLPDVALCAWKEARGQGQEGMAAVVCVLFNRARAWGKSLHDTVYQRNQFTSMSVPSDPEYSLKPRAGDPQYALCLTLAGEVFDGTQPDITGGALYYWNPRTANSPWFSQHIAGDPINHPQRATIGDQVFYA